MKSVSFIPNCWRKKDKKRKLTSQAIFQVPAASPPFKPLGLCDVTSLLSLDSISTFEHSSKQSQPHENFTGRALSLGNGLDRYEPIPAQLVPQLYRKNPSSFPTSHGPPRNLSHGPPSINIGARPLYATAPHRPPHSPSLKLFTHPQRSERPAARVKFAPDLLVRPSQPTSPMRGRRTSIVSEELRDSLSQDVAYEEVTSHYFDETRSDIPDSPPTISSLPSLSPLTDDFARTGCAPLIFTDVPMSTGPYHGTNSSPHLPLTTKMLSLPKLEPRNGSVDDLPLSQDTSALFPQRLPIRVRKRPHPLVLLPTPTVAPQPPSPLLSSTDSTPLATPNSGLRSSNVSSPKSAKFPGRLLHTVPPPTHSPPNSPLPTPPILSEFWEEPSEIFARNPPKGLRSVRSISELRENRIQHIVPAHRVTASAPSHDFIVARETAPHRLKLVGGSPASPLSGSAKLGSTSELPINWGYAV